MIYNINLKPDIGLSIRKLLDLIKNVNINNTIFELELKFKNLSKDDFLLYSRALDSVSGDLLDKQVIEDIVYINGDYREIVSNESTSYIIKKRIENIDFNLEAGLNKTLNFRLSLASETQIEKNKFNKTNSPLIRKRTRTSFFNPNRSIRIDLTYIQTSDKSQKDISPSYEVEIEFLDYFENNFNLDLITKYKNLFQLIKEGLGYILPENHSLISYDSFKNTIFDLLRFHTENKPVNIQVEHIPLLEKEKYYVTNKLDGTKYNLLVRFTPNDILQLILVNPRDLWFLYNNPPKDIDNSSLVIFDVEIVENKSFNILNNISIHIFDTIYSSADNDILNKPLADRLDVFNLIPSMNSLQKDKKIVNCDIYLYKKTFFYDESIILSIQKVLRLMYKNANNSFSNLEKNNDGIIFQPYNRSYHSKSKYEDKTKSYIPILKWKFPEKVSIDFKVIKDNFGSYKLLSFSDKKEVEFTDQNGNTYPLYLSEQQKKEVTNGSIIEVTFDNIQNVFIYHRTRNDKLRPNVLKPTARETFIDMKTKFTLERLINLLSNNNFTPSKDIIIEIPDINIVRSIQTNKPINEQYNFPKNRNFNALQVTDEGIKFSINYDNTTKNILTDTLNQLTQDNLNINELTYLDINAFIGSTYFSFSPYFKRSFGIEQNENNYKALTHNCSIFNSSPHDILNINFKDLKENDFKDLFCEINPNVILITPRSYSSNELYIDSSKEIPLNLFITYIFKYCDNLNLILIRSPPNFKLSFDHSLKSIKYTNYHRQNILDVFYLNRCLYVYRKIHNKVKSYLIQNYCSNAQSILDIGSGKGGDLNKYKILEKSGLQTLFLVEPSETNMNELIDRLNKIKTISKINYVPFIAGGEDTKKISNLLKSNDNKNSVDVVSMFYILTFFFKDEKMLDNLVNTISSSLNDDGLFIGTTFDGYRTFELLNETNIENNCFSIKKISDFNLNTFDNKVEIDFKGTETATKQLEYLVYFNIFINKLKEKHIYLEHEYYFDEDIISDILSADENKTFILDNLNSKEKLLNRLYKFFVFRKSLPSDITQPIVSNLNPLILSTNNYNYLLEDKLNSSLIQPIQLISHIDKDVEIKTKKQYYRIGAIGSDNNCFFHSILTANDFSNYNKLSYNEKIKCASKLREDTVNKITQDIFEFISLGSIGYPLFLKEFYRQISILIDTDNQISNLSRFYIYGNINKNKFKELIKDYIFKDQIYSVDITNKVLYVIDKLINEFQTDKVDYSYIKNTILNIGNISRENVFINYKKSLLHIKKDVNSFRYTKYVTNEDIEIFNYLLNIQVILISDSTFYPITYTSYKY